jgi:ketosteroid isomerase-like protein
MRYSFRALVPVLALILATAAPLAAAPPPDPDPRSLIAFADAFDKAQLARDGAALDAMVDSGLVFIDGSGRRQDKQAFIAGWTAPEDRFDPIVLQDRLVVMLGPDAGMVSAETTLRGTSGGKPFASHFRYTDAFRREDGTWRAVHIQVTRMP